MNDTLSVDSVYAETCSNIPTTDDISFKLMSAVPVLSGAALLTLFFKEPIPNGKLLAVRGSLLWGFATSEIVGA